MQILTSETGPTIAGITTEAKKEQFVFELCSAITEVGFVEVHAAAGGGPWFCRDFSPRSRRWQEWF